MPLTMENAESAVLVATARHKRWLANFFKTWTQPQRDFVMLRWWDTLSPAMKQRAKEINPEQFAEIEKRIEGLRSREQ